MAEFSEADRIDVHFFVDQMLKRGARRRESRDEALARCQAELLSQEARIRTLALALKGVLE